MVIDLLSSDSDSSDSSDEEEVEMGASLHGLDTEPGDDRLRCAGTTTLLLCFVASAMRARRHQLPDRQKLQLNCSLSVGIF